MGTVTLATQAAPSTPSSGNIIVYSKVDGLLYWKDSAGTEYPVFYSAANITQPINIQEFRLTLTTATPVTTADVTAAGTLYCTPYKGNRIALYDGSSVWNIRTSSEFSLALTATSGKPYDVFCYDNAGTPTLETLVWTNDTTRATALVYQNGVLVKSGATTRRYLGTFYASGTNTTEDSYVKRYLFNYYNRVKKPLKRFEATTTWNYTTATIRQANASTSNQVEVMVGVSEDVVDLSLIVASTNGTASTRWAGIGLDSVTVAATSAAVAAQSNDNGYWTHHSAFYSDYPGLGRHYLSWLEASEAAGTTAWKGSVAAAASGANVVCGLNGAFWC